MDILKRYSDEQHPLSAADISQRLLDYAIESERKSIYADIAALEQYGCDIIKTSKGWFIGEREFELPETYLLCDAVSSAKFITAKKTREILGKLYGMMSIYQARRSRNRVYFGMADKCGNESLYYNIDRISRAVEENRQIKLIYSSRKLGTDGQIAYGSKEMTVNPYAMTWQDDYYYLIANHTKYDNLIHLRIDRIRDVEITDVPARSFSQVSEYTDFFDVADYTNKLFGMYSGEIQKIELYCSNSIAEQVFDRFGEDVLIRGKDGEGFILRVQAALSDALVTWIINYGRNIKVISPESLKEMVVGRAKAVLENYTQNGK